MAGVCVVCDEEVAALCEVKHGHAFAARRKGPRGRGRDKTYDTKMSFRDF